MDDSFRTGLRAEIAAAWGAHQWDSVLHKAAQFRQNSPPDATVEQANIEALRGTARHAEAAEAIDRAAIHFDGEAWLEGERTKLALDQGQIARTVELAEALRLRFPSFMDGYVLGAGALRQLRRDDEARRLLEAGAVLEPQNFWILTERTSLAEMRGDWDEVAALAEAMRRQSPNYEPGYRMALNALRRLGRTQEAERVVAQAIETLSLQPWLCIEAMEIAQQEQQFEQADCWLIRGMRRFPMDSDLALFHGARPARDPDERARHAGNERAITRLNSVLEDFPGLPDAVAALAETLTGARRLEEAEALLAANFDAVKASPRAANTWAYGATIKGDSVVAASRYGRVLEWFPDNPYGYEGLMIALASCGDRGAAEQVCATAIARFPESLPVMMAQVKVAELVEDLELAVDLMAALADRFPAEPFLKHRLYALRLKLGDTGHQAAVSRNHESSAPETDPKSVMMRCQSIGGTGLGCEFGLVQRRFDAEPLSLLRWGNVPHLDLIRGIARGFEGIEAEDDMEIELEEHRADAQYEVISKQYKIRFHSFMYLNEISEQDFRRRMQRRLIFLRQLFIDDLRAARHLFVRKQEAPIPPLAEIDELHQAVAAYGDNSLLYVFPEDPEHPSGTVVPYKPGIIFGYLDRFIATASGDLSAACWLQICTRAHQIWQSDHRQPRLP